jgi:ABC-2 type transport system ATP-binding protein
LFVSARVWSTSRFRVEPPPLSPRAAPAPVLRVEGFSKSYEDRPAVSDLSFEVGAGEVLGLVGPNGAGKTTTLRSVAGILPVRSGRILVCGHDVSTDEARAKSSLCWVPDDPQPFDALTVEEHLEFTAALYGLTDWSARASELIERFELGEKRGALGGELSRGMRQKLAFCCAWLPRPRLVLMDEPLSGLDPRGIRSAKQAIRDLAAEGTGVILSSHLLELIEELAHRLLILDHGRRVFDGTLDEARATLAPREGSTLEEIFMAATGGRSEPRAEAGGEASAEGRDGGRDGDAA